MGVHVVSKRSGGTQPAAGETVVYIGRPNVLGNPFAISAVNSRAQVIEQYRAWLRAEYAKKGQVRNALDALAARVHGGEHIALQCWCAPLACHGDVIADAIDKINAKK